MTDPTTFDFDYWSALAKNDPAAFELQRQQLINSTLDAAPTEMRPRLEGLQWRIDRIRDRSASPMGACLRISELMWDRVLGENGLVEALQALSEGRSHAPAASTAKRPSAQILDLDRKQ